jgi:hypothetical protein
MSNDACFKEREQESEALRKRGVAAPVTPPATILRLGPNTKLPNTSGSPTQE